MSTSAGRHGRPLDAHETAALQRIEQAERDADPEFPTRLGSPPGSAHPPVRETGTALSFRLVATVTLVTFAYAGLLVLLPSGMTVGVVLLTLIVLVPAACLGWAIRRALRDRRG